MEICDDNIYYSTFHSIKNTFWINKYALFDKITFWLSAGVNEMSRRAPNNNEYRLKFNISKGLVSSSKFQNVQVPDLFLTEVVNHLELPGLSLLVLINDI